MLNKRAFCATEEEGERFLTSLKTKDIETSGGDRVPYGAHLSVVSHFSTHQRRQKCCRCNEHILEDAQNLIKVIEKGTVLIFAEMRAAHIIDPFEITGYGPLLTYVKPALPH